MEIGTGREGGESCQLTAVSNGHQSRLCHSDPAAAAKNLPNSKDKGMNQYYVYIMSSYRGIAEPLPGSAESWYEDRSLADPSLHSG